MRLKWSPCCLVLGLVILICIVIYIVGYINFSAKEKRFDNLRIGAKEIEVYLNLGKPSRTVLLSGEGLKAFYKIDVPEDYLRKNKFMELV